MYIFELISKLIKEKKSFKKPNKKASQEEYEECDHIFAPVDSTKKILACTKCGIIKKL